MAAAALLAACGRPSCLGPSAVVTVREQTHMTTYVTISVAAREGPAVESAIEAAFGEVARQEKLLSEWQEASEVSAVNRQAGVAPVAVGDELFQVVRLARTVSEATGGAFDVSFAALTGLWDFRFVSQRVPTREELAARLPLIDWKAIRLDEAARTVMLDRPGMRIGLGAIAKGWAVDRASAVLTARGFKNHLVVAGGDLYASGTRLDRKWSIGVRDPENRGVWAVLEVQDEGVATSGNYEKFFVRDGVRYHHIMDPKTGMPARGTSSVTVIAPDAARADAWATGMFVMGSTRGRPVAQGHRLEVLWFDEAFRSEATPGMQARLRRTQGAPAGEALAP